MVNLQALSLMETITIIQCNKCTNLASRSPKHLFKMTKLCDVRNIRDNFQKRISQKRRKKC